jgi:DNA polymerase-1
VDTNLHRVGAWGAIKFAYEEQGLTEDDALLQARLARILRWDDWDNENGVPRLWGNPNDK